MLTVSADLVGNVLTDRLTAVVHKPVHHMPWMVPPVYNAVNKMHVHGQKGTRVVGGNVQSMYVYPCNGSSMMLFLADPMMSYTYASLHPYLGETIQI